MSIDPYQKLICRNCWEDFALDGYYRCNFCLNVGEITMHGMKVRFDELLTDFYYTANCYNYPGNDKSLGKLQW